jgi:hypothetical protein
LIQIKAWNARDVHLGKSGMAISYSLLSALGKKSRMKSVSACLLGAYLTFVSAASAQAPEDVELEQFRAAYISGAGLAYILLRDEKGERLYRYGDASREAAKRDRVGYMLFTCAAPHMFLRRDPKARASLAQARVVNPGDRDFAELDRRYLAGCRNPMVKSAMPKNQSRE